VWPPETPLCLYYGDEQYKSSGACVLSVFLHMLPTAREHHTQHLVAERWESLEAKMVTVPVEDDGHHEVSQVLSSFLYYEEHLKAMRYHLIERGTTAELRLKGPDKLAHHMLQVATYGQTVNGETPDSDDAYPTSVQLEDYHVKALKNASTNDLETR